MVGDPPASGVMLVPLGRSGLTISAIGAGTWQWGDRLYWGYGREYGQDDLRAAFTDALDAGITLFDTAEIYGLGRSEKIIGRLLKERSSGSSATPIIATKFFPMPWRLRRAALIRALRGSLRRLGLEKIDLYQVHWPMGPRDVAHWARALADAHDAGLVRAVGVSNYGVPQMLRAHDALAARGIPLSSNQVGFSLLNRSAERSGLLDAARELGVTVIAYAPLGEGLLSGKYSSERPPPLLRRLRYARKWLPKLPPLIGLMREIGRAHGGATPAQVALGWCIANGTVPVPGVKRAEQARDAAAAMSLQLSPDEMAALDQATAAY